MAERFEFVKVKDNSTLRESFELEDIASLRNESPIEEKEGITETLKEYIHDFERKYIVSGITNTRLDGYNYIFPVLAPTDYSVSNPNTFFPELLVFNGVVTVNYHITRFRRIPINSD